MELNIAERIALIGVLPQQGSAVTLRVIRELQTQLSFTEEEIAHYNIENDSMPDGRTRMTWNPELTDETKDIKIGKAANKAIVAQLTKLNAMSQLHISMLPIYDKFIKSEDEDQN